MFKIPVRKIIIFLFIFFEMIIALLTLKICGEQNSNTYIGWITSITLIFDCAIMKYMNIRIYSPASVFIILSYLFSFGQFIIETFFSNYVFRYENIIRYNMMDVYNTAVYCFVIIQLIFIGIILQRSISPKNECKIYEEKKIDYKHIKTVGIVITTICFPVWLYYNVHTYTLSQAKGGYVVGASQMNGIVVEFSYFIIVGMVLLLIGFSTNKRVQKIILIVEIGLLLISMLTGNRLFAIGAVCVVFYCYKMLTQKQLLRQTIITIIVFYFVAGIVTSISHLRMNSALTISSILNDSVSNSNQTFLYVLEEFGGSFKTPLLAIQQVPSYTNYAYGITYIKSLITLIPNINETIRAIYQQSIFLFSLHGTAAMGGSYIGELYYNFGYFSYIIAIPMGAIIGKLTDDADCLISNKKFVDFSYYIMVIFGLYMWVRGYFTEMIRGPIWAALLIYIVNRIVVFLGKKRYEP